jgi:hypothetical protein
MDDDHRTMGFDAIVGGMQLSLAQHRSVSAWKPRCSEENSWGCAVRAAQTFLFEQAMNK